MDTKNTEGAFRWIVSLLSKHKIPYEITGGFAARLYGSKRELADIDIVIPEGEFQTLRPCVRPFVTYGPKRYSDDSWDLTLMTLLYEGQLIDISSADEKHFDHSKREWISVRVDLIDVTFMEVDGLRVPVIPKQKLITYKREIGREVDLADLKEMT